MSLHSDPELMRVYKRNWVAGRRRDWMAGKSCEWCGSDERLEIDHIDPGLKVTNTIWSWTTARRNVELSKCRVLCHDCHVKRHAAPHGTTGRYKRHGCRCRECTDANTRAARKTRGGWRNKIAAAKPDHTSSEIRTSDYTLRFTPSRPGDLRERSTDGSALVGEGCA